MRKRKATLCIKNTRTGANRKVKVTIITDGLFTTYDPPFVLYANEVVRMPKVKYDLGT